LSTGKKPIERHVPELLKAKLGHSKPIFPMFLEVIYQDQDLKIAKYGHF